MFSHLFAVLVDSNGWHFLHIIILQTSESSIGRYALQLEMHEKDKVLVKRERPHAPEFRCLLPSCLALRLHQQKQAEPCLAHAQSLCQQFGTSV